MDSLKKEIRSNFSKFKKSLHDTIAFVSTDLAKQDDDFAKSFEVATSIQAWKSCLLEAKYTTNPAYGFILESQNDLLTSHTLATLGIWRGAHKFLRSMMENILCFIYYKDHPIEYQLWCLEKHWLPFKDLISYIESHPIYLSLPDPVRYELSGIKDLKKQYGDLSNAVHGALNSRMTTIDDFPNVVTSEQKFLGQWITQERKSLTALNKIMILFFHEELSGAKQENLRKVISLTVRETNYRELLHNKLGVRLID